MAGSIRLLNSGNVTAELDANVIYMYNTAGTQKIFRVTNDGANTRGILDLYDSDVAKVEFDANGISFISGNLGIGNVTDPGKTLGVGSSNQMTVDSSGNIATSGSYTQSGTSANTFTGTPTFSNATTAALFSVANVGIASASPGHKLDVQGTVRMVGF